MGMSIADALGEAKGELNPSDLYYLLGYSLRRDRTFLLSHPEYEISHLEWLRWRRMKRRRIKGMPAAYLTGEKEFYGISFHVNRHTLIPRPETELLVDEVIHRHPASVLDMGTGSGCIAVALAMHLPGCRITAVDISRRALAMARRNALRHVGPGQIQFVRSEYFNRIGSARYEVIVANPPYVREGDVEQLEPSVAAYEPGVALYAGRDGLQAYRHILREGSNYLVPGGAIILEIAPDLSTKVQELAREYGYRKEKMERDLSGMVRMIVLVSS